MDETNVARTRMWAPATIKPECHSSRPKQRERDYVQACCINIEHAVEQWAIPFFGLRSAVSAIAPTPKMLCRPYS